MVHQAAPFKQDYLYSVIIYNFFNIKLLQLSRINSKSPWNIQGHEKLGQQG
jgi:hypothetical protein